MKFRDRPSGSLSGVREEIVTVSCEEGLKLLNHNLGFFLAGIDKLSHLFQGWHSNAVLTSGFEISSEWFRVVLIKSLSYYTIDMVNFCFLEGLFAMFLIGFERDPLVRLLCTPV